MFVSGKLHTISVQRHQAPIQLAFSSTAHGAQGKTMPAIGSDLNFGGAKAYVIASRAQDRGGLALLQPVTLEGLNEPPPLDLRIEHRRQKALEHNTLIRLGYIEGDYVEVPDPESGLQLTDRAGRVKLTWNVEGKADTSSRSLKRPSITPANRLSDSSKIFLLFFFDYPS